MLNFKNLLSNALNELNKSFDELEKAGIICERSFYQYKDYTPFLPTVIDIANYLEISLDYLTERLPENNFKKYKTDQTNFYDNLINIMKSYGISQSELSRKTQITRPNFTYWKQGKLPKLETLVLLADYLNCSIDDLLETDQQK